MSVLVPIISDIVLSIDSIDTIVESFQKGYLDHVDEVDSIIDECSRLQALLEQIKKNKNFRNTNISGFWDEVTADVEGKKYSLMEALLSILYFILITKEKYSIDIPLLCADLYMNILLLPGAFGHGMIRCSLFQVTVSAILRSVNNEEVLHMDSNYKTTPSQLINTLLMTIEVLDELTINFAWIELSSLCYECSFNSSLTKQLSLLFTKLLTLSEKDTENKIGELFRILLPIFSLYQEGRKMDEKIVRKSQDILLSILNSTTKPCFSNPKYALIQRLMINCPDRADDRRNTVNCIVAILSHIPVVDRSRYNDWILHCSVCEAFNIRMCSIHLVKALLTSQYMEDIDEWKKEEEKKNEDEEEAFVANPSETVGMSSTELSTAFFSILIDRCKDITISIRCDSIHLLSDVLEYSIESKPTLLQAILNDQTIKRITATITDCIFDSAVGVRKNGLTALGVVLQNEACRTVFSEKEVLEMICNLLQDTAVSVRKSAIQLFYKLLPSFPSFIPFFFPISISMFESSSNTDSIIIKSCQQFVLDPIITWNNNTQAIDGWRYMEYFTSNNIPVFESILKLLIEKNTLSLGKVASSCMKAIQWIHKTSIDIEEDELKEQVPHIEENAWLLLSILVKYYKRMDIQFCTNQIELLIQNCSPNTNVNRDKYIIQLAITILPKIETPKVKQFYTLLANQLLRLNMHIDLIHSYLRLYLAIINQLYSDIHSVEKAVNMFVQRMEKKVDKVLREFIFRSGGTLHLEIPNSQPRLSQEVDPAFSQPFSPNEENEDLLNTSTLLDDNPDFSWLFPYIFIIGELAILGMEESEEGNLSKLKIHLTNRSIALLQALTTNSLPTLNSSQGVSIPTCIRAHAFISFGKLCITSAALAKKHLPMFIRELELSKNSAIRNNIIIVIGDICSKHTSIVERYIPTIANCIVDEDTVVRIHALSIISKLVLEDYIKLKPALLCCLLSSLIDSDDSIAAFSYQLITKQIYRKFPKIFVTNFVEIVCILNGYLPSSIIKETGVKQINIHLEGGDKRVVNDRKRIYRVILELLDDESKLQISCKLCQNLLGPLVDDDEISSLNNDSQSTQLNTIKDTFAILCSKELKIGSRTKSDDEELPTEVLESKKAVLSKLEKRTMLEQVLPLLISLKYQFEKRRSVLLRDLMLYFKVITVNFKQEMEVVFNENPRLKREIEYDIRHFDETKNESDSREKNETGVNTLATPVVNRKMKGNSSVHSTPRLKQHLNTISSTPVKEAETAAVRTSSLELKLSLTTDEKEKEEWKMDAKRLSFTSPVKEKKKRVIESDFEEEMDDLKELKDIDEKKVEEEKTEEIKQTEQTEQTEQTNQTKTTDQAKSTKQTKRSSRKRKR